jgi:hypothetical protein
MAFAHTTLQLVSVFRLSTTVSTKIPLLRALKLTKVFKLAVLTAAISFAVTSVHALALTTLALVSAPFRLTTTITKTRCALA